jgi:hypothetical protein
MRKKLIFGVLALCCCSVFLLTGCSKDDDGAAATPTVKTPIQLLEDSVDSRFITVNTQLGTKASNTDLSALANRVGTLEGSIAPDLSGIEGRITGLESLNISDAIARLSFLELQYETLINSGTPAGATPTPTPTPIVQCGVQKPSVITPAYGDMNVLNGSVHFEWSNCANAVSYEFWIGTDPASMMNWKNISAPARFLDYPVAADTYYYWKIVAVSPCNEKIADAFWFKTQ